MAKKFSSSFLTCTNYAWNRTGATKITNRRKENQARNHNNRTPGRPHAGPWTRARRCPRATSTSPMTSGTYSATSRPPKSDQNLTTPCLCIQARNKGSAPRNEVQEAPSPRSGSHARSDYIRSNARSDSGNTSPSGTD